MRFKLCTAFTACTRIHSGRVNPRPSPHRHRAACQESRAAILVRLSSIRDANRGSGRSAVRQRRRTAHQFGHRHRQGDGVRVCRPKGVDGCGLLRALGLPRPLVRRRDLPRAARRGLDRRSRSTVRRCPTRDDPRLAQSLPIAVSGRGQWHRRSLPPPEIRPGPPRHRVVRRRYALPDEYCSTRRSTPQFVLVLPRAMIGL